MILAIYLVNAFLVYLMVGTVFAVLFVTKGVGRMDADARSGSWGFRLMVFPGSMLLWPYLLLRWLKSAGPRPEQNPHRLSCRGVPEDSEGEVGS